MKKKIFFTFLIMVMLLPILLRAQAVETCDTSNILIGTPTIEQVSNGVTEIETARVDGDGKDILVNIKMSSVGDSIKYKFNVTNNSEEDFDITNSGQNVNTTYFKYLFSSSDESNIIKSGETKLVYLTISYNSEIPDSAYDNNGEYNDEKTLLLNLSTDISDSNNNSNNNENTNNNTNNTTDNVVNPKTGTEATLLLLIVTLFFGSIVYVIISGKKSINHFVILICLSLVLPLSIYATCTCSINVVSKIKVTKPTLTPPSSIDGISPQELKSLGSSQGVYADANQNGRYIFKGSNPNNRLIIGNNIYYIISIEADNTLKVIKADGINGLVFDPGYTTSINNITQENEVTGTRYNPSGNYCYTSTSNTYYGCKLWGNSNTTYMQNALDLSNDGLPKIIGNNNKFKTTSESYINIYLNGGTYLDNQISGWYANINESDSQYIVNHEFNVGLVSPDEQSLSADLSQEKAYKWNGKIGLMNATDYVNASSNTNCNSINAYTNSSTCYSNSPSHNYLATNTKQLTINPVSASNNYSIWSINSNHQLTSNGKASDTFSVRPVFYLSSNVKLYGSGTADSPYTFTANLD